MKTLILIVILCLCVQLNVFSQDASQRGITGTWRLISMTYRNPVSGAETDLWGKAPAGLLTYTPEGRMSAVIASQDRNIPESSAAFASTEEKAMLFSSFIAYAGTYTRTDTCIVHHVEVASDPTWTGTDQIRYVHLTGKQMIITAPRIRTVSDPDPKVLKLIWEKVDF